MRVRGRYRDVHNFSIQRAETERLGERRVFIHGLGHEPSRDVTRRLCRRVCIWLLRLDLLAAVPSQRRRDLLRLTPVASRGRRDQLRGILDEVHRQHQVGQTNRRLVIRVDAAELRESVSWVGQTRV